MGWINPADESLNLLFEIFIISDDDLPKFEYKAPEEHSIEEDHEIFIRKLQKMKTEHPLLKRWNTAMKEKYATEVNYEETDSFDEDKEDESDDIECERRKTIDMKQETEVNDAPQQILEQ